MSEPLHILPWGTRHLRPLRNSVTVRGQKTPAKRGLEWQIIARSSGVVKKSNESTDSSVHAARWKSAARISANRYALIMPFSPWRILFEREKRVFST